MAGPVETELKFVVSREASSQLWAHPALRAPERTEQLRSTYFDTPDRRLHAGRMALRLRDASDGRVQTLKQYGGPSAVSRGEWETKIEGDRIDRDALAGTPAAKTLDADSDRLEPVFVTEVERSIRLCAEKGALIEVGYDRGQLTAGDRSAPICELELELKRGDPEALFALARRVASDVDIRLSFESKSARGYRLARGDELKPRKARMPALDPGMMAADLFKVLALNCLGQAIANAEILSAHAKPEVLHQLRVGVRRLRAVIKAFEMVSGGPEADAVDGELEWLAAELDQARDLQVLIKGTYASGLRRLASDGMAELGQRLTDAKARAYDRAGDAVRSRRTARLWLEAAAWVETGQWTKDQDPLVVSARELPARPFAHVALDHLRKVVRKRGRRWDRLDAKGRHKLRIRVKRMRYMAELLEPLFPAKSKSVRRFNADLAALQDRLGELNDIAFARSSALGASKAGKAACAFALGRLVGLREAGELELLASAGAAVKRFRKSRPFWS
jgi:inorganic triphosphatase YgiF